MSKQGSSFSGRLLLRLPKSLHGELARCARTEGISLNQFICLVLAAELSWRTGSSENVEKRARFRTEEKRRRKKEVVDEIWRDVFR